MPGKTDLISHERDMLLGLLADAAIDRNEAVLDARRPDAVAKQHAKGALTACERIALLLDEGESFVEYGALAPAGQPRP